MARASKKAAPVVNPLQDAIRAMLRDTIELAGGKVVTGRSSYAITGHLRCEGFPIPGSDENCNRVFEQLGFTIGKTVKGHPIVYIA